MAFWLPRCCGRRQALNNVTHISHDPQNVIPIVPKAITRFESGIPRTSVIRRVRSHANHTISQRNPTKQHELIASFLVGLIQSESIQEISAAVWCTLRKRSPGHSHPLNRPLPHPHSHRILENIIQTLLSEGRALSIPPSPDVGGDPDPLHLEYLPSIPNRDYRTPQLLLGPHQNKRFPMRLYQRPPTAHDILEARLVYEREDKHYHISHCNADVVEPLCKVLAGSDVEVGDLLYLRERLGTGAVEDVLKGCIVVGCEYVEEVGCEKSGFACVAGAEEKDRYVFLLLLRLCGRSP